jgi:methionyl-tRNA formyltransferase
MTHPTPSKILICGKGALACRALGYLVDYLRLAELESKVLVMPVASDGGTDTWEPSLRATAAARGVTCVTSIQAAELIADDMLLSLQFDQIIRLPTLGGARAFNLHFSALPAYRGCYTSVWPLRNGEKQAGVTLHVLTAGIDDGNIVGQRVFDVPEWTSSWGLYGLLQDHAYALFREYLPILLRREEQTRPQPPTTIYYSRQSLDFSKTEIDVAGMSPRQAVDTIRSMIFDPRQFPTFRGREIMSCEVVEGLPARPEAPGSVILESPGHLVLLCQGGAIRLRWHA